MSQILITKYKTGVDFPPLRTGLTHLAGENTLTFPYKAGDAQDSFSNDSGVHLCMINAGSLMLTDDTDTFSVAFNASDLTITWHSQRNSLRDIDDVVFVFNAFAKPVSGMTKLIYTGSAGQTVFTGDDDAGVALAFQNESVMVFVNDKFQDTSDFTTSGGNTVTLGASATAVSAGDKVSIIVFDSVITQQSLSVIQTNASNSATDASQHATTASRWAKEADTTSVVDADTGVDSNEYSAKSYAQGTGTPNGSAKEWASKTGSPVAGSEYSAKYWATSPAVTNVSTNINAITTVNTNLSSVQTISNNISDVTSLASSLGGVTTYVVTVVGGVYYLDGSSNPTLTMERGNSYVFDLSDSSNSGHPLAFKSGTSPYTTGVTTTGTAGQSGAQVRIDVSSTAPATLRYYCTVHGNAMGNTISVINSNFSIVAANIGNVNTTATNIGNINTAAGSASDINTLVGQITPTNNVSTLAGISGQISTVAGVASDITTVAGQITNNNLQSVASDIADVVAVANDLQETTSEIDTVANAITNVDNVGNNIANVNTVAGQIAPTNNISTVAGAATAINQVGPNIGNVNIVGNNINDVQTVASISAAVSTAATNVTQFNETYHGPSASAPTSNVTTGDLWFDTTNNTMKVYNGTGWINSGSSVNGTSERVSYIVGTNSGSYTSGSTTVFPVVYDAGFVDVYLRGIKLVNGSDFTATNGTTITLSSAAVAGDPIDIVAYGTFQLNNTTLTDLTDVNVSSPTNNQILQYNSTNSRFENADLSAASPGFALAMSVALG